MTLFSTDRQLHCIYGYVMQKDFQHEKMLSPQTALHYIHKQSMILENYAFTKWDGIVFGDVGRQNPIFNFPKGFRGYKSDHSVFNNNIAI
jgi:hypothetical protein